ncbi:hypothetical protein EKO25_14925 [Bacillus sp. SAJ1]|nr:hypothetical protein EKO25_14925 [Bacillus sp. SAJ1]
MVIKTPRNGASMIRFILAFIIAVLAGTVLTILNVPEILVFIIAYIIVFAVLLSPVLYSLYRSKNMEKLEKFLVKRQRHPYYQFIYGMANKNDCLIEEAFTKLQKKPRRKSFQAYIQTFYALYKQNPEEAKKFVNGIQTITLKNYYEVVIAIEENNLQEAKKLMQKPLKPWMIHALSAELEKKHGNLDKASEHANKAMELTRGLLIFRTGKPTPLGVG